MTQLTLSFNEIIQWCAVAAIIVIAVWRVVRHLLRHGDTTDCGCGGCDGCPLSDNGCRKKKE